MVTVNDETNNPTGEEEVTPTTDKSYTPTEWHSGDIVSSTKLNNIQTGITDLYTRTEDLYQMSQTPMPTILPISIDNDDNAQVDVPSSYIELLLSDDKSFTFRCVNDPQTLDYRFLGYNSDTQTLLLQGYSPTLQSTTILTLYYDSDANGFTTTEPEQGGGEPEPGGGGGK